MRAALLLLAACGDPISNRDLAADGEFLGALPSEARLGAPAVVRDFPLGDSALLGDAQGALAALDGLTVGARASTATLVATTPTERSDLLRAWEPVAAAAEIDGETRLWWITADIVRADADADLEWEIRASAGKDGEYAVVGEGRHDPAGAGTFAWDAAAFARILDLPVDHDALEGVYDDFGADDGGRDVAVTGSRGGIPAGTWALVTTAAFAWSGTFAVTADGEALPGFALAYGIAGVGGRLAGEVVRGEEPVAWEACWNAAGDDVYLDGDAGVARVGVPGNCAVDPL